MSGLNEIIQWVEDNYDFEEGEDVQTAFEKIDKDEDWRSPLADILGSELPQFMEFLEDVTHTAREDIIIKELEERAFSIEREIEALSQPLFNILGTPIR